MPRSVVHQKSLNSARLFCCALAPLSSDRATLAPGTFTFDGGEPLAMVRLWGDDRKETLLGAARPLDAGWPRQSHFYFSAHLINPALAERAILEGELVVDWASKPPGAELPAVKRIDSSRLTLKTRQGEPPFQPILVETVTPPEKSYFIDPLILHDLDGDGLSEIILAAKNLVYRRHTGDRYEAGPLCRYPPGLIFTGNSIVVIP